MNYILNSAYWNLSDPTSIPNLFIGHVAITLVSVVLGFIIAFAISLVVMRYARAYVPTTTIAGIIYTLPSLAFMAFLIPFTGLSPATVIIPLVLYTQIVLIRNIVAAIRAVDPALIEVGRAMGMNTTQLQLRVMLPLALPVIVAGLRVATVTTIGIASIAPLFGVEDLGYLIFQGINFSYSDQVLAGVILVSALAVGVDLLLLGLQALLSKGRSLPSAA
jgi:osmoprotectant transport system permease protein